MKLSLRDTIELLANLDFVVEKLRDGSGRPHKAEVLQALEPRLRKPYSSRQIDSRIKSLCGSADPKTIQDIYRYGSCRIKDLDADLKLKVQEELKIIKSEEVCILVSTPRQLRSVSRHPATERSRSRRASTVFGERTPTRSAFRHHATESSRSKRGSANYSECTPTKTVRKTQGGELQARVSNFAENEPLSLEQDPPNRDTIIVQTQKFRPRPTTTPPCTSIADTEERIKSSQSSVTCREGSPSGAPSLQSDLQSFFYATELQDTPAIDYDDLNTAEQFPEKLVLDCSHEILRDLFNDNLYFRKKWSDSEERCKKIDRNGRLRHSLLAPGSADVLQTMADTIETQNEKIYALQRQLSNQTFLQQFLILGRGKEVPINQSQIQSYHAKMRRDFRSLSIMNCFQHRRETAAPTVQTAACFESRDLTELKSKVVSDVNCYPIGLVIQSLTGAAVCEWVFNGKMQCTAMMNTPLLEGYRYHLRTICGELVLRNFDLAAHQWVINEEQHFRDEFLPRTASKLSERLLNALGPFMKNSAKPEAKLQIRLKSIFCAALNIKTFGMIGKNVFEFIWPAHNSIFERNFMVKDSSEGATSNQSSSKQEATKVTLALVPGLLIYSYDRKLVDYCGFTRDDEEGLEEPSLVAQAVVAAL